MDGGEKSYSRRNKFGKITEKYCIKDFHKGWQSLCFKMKYSIGNKTQCARNFMHSQILLKDYLESLKA